MNDQSLAVLELAEVRDAVKANWAEFYTHLGQSPVAELTTGPHLSWLLTGIPDAFLNAVFRADIPPDVVAEVVDEAISRFQEGRVERLSWWADEASGEIGRQLLARGLILDAGATAMAVDLSTLPDRLDLPLGLGIVPVDDEDRLKAWTHLSCINFEVPVRAESRVLDLFAPIAMEPPMHSYLALLDGRPVATSQLFLGAGVAGIYSVTTLPDVRGRGIGKVVTYVALAEARRQGYGLGILQASDLGVPVYRRLGFQSFGRLQAYTYSAG